MFVVVDIYITYCKLLNFYLFFIIQEILTIKFEWIKNKKKKKKNIFLYFKKKKKKKKEYFFYFL